jgi:hypothetical protein
MPIFTTIIFNKVISPLHFNLKPFTYEKNFTYCYYEYTFLWLQKR